MSEEQEQAVQTEAQPTQKEINLGLMRQKYERELQAERQRRLDMEKRLEELEASKRRPVEEDDEEDEPYVDTKRLKKTLNRFGEETRKATQTEIERAVNMALNEERKNQWMKSNSDFMDVLSHADKLAEVDPEMADTILKIPDQFERQKMAYKTIKAMRLHEPAKKEDSIQSKVDANRRSPYYQPSGVGSTPYVTQGDFSPQGQKQAYDHLQQLKKRMGWQ